MAFSCNATNLHPDDGDGTSDVFLRDLATSATTLVSRAAGAAGAKANGAAREPVISGDGTRVAFETGDTNLVAGDTDTTYDIVVRNLGDATNTLASRQTGAAGAKGTSSSFYPDLSQDGTKVAFRSSGLGAPSGQVYVRDLGATTTTLVSRATGAGGAAADALSDRPTISDDGTRVAFETGAQNLSGIDTNGSLTDVYVRDLTGNATTLVSESFGTAGSSASAGAALSGDGLVAGFQTEADNLTTQDSDDFVSIVRRRLTQNGMSLVSRPTGTGGFGGDGTAESSITCCGTPASADGSIVAFSSQTDTISPDDDNRFRNAFVRDARTGETTLLSRQTGPGGAPADGDSAAVAVSADGRRAAFVSSATNLVAGGDANGTQQDLFVRDLGTGETMLVSRGPGAAGPQGGSSVFVAALDADGSAVAFSTSSNLVPGSASGIDVYVRDIAAADTVLASRADGELGAAVNSDAEIAISGDGRVVAFTSDAAIAGAPGGVDQIFARDLGAGTTTLVSRAPGAAGAAGGFSSRSPALDADGSRVAFASYASNLALDDPDTAGDVFVRDRATGETLLASRATGASGVKGDGESEDPTLSADGTRVLFTSSSSNLVAGGTGSQAYLRDLASQTTILAARADGSAGAPADPITARLTAGGHCVVFESSRRGLAPEYSGEHRQVYLRALDAECPAPVPPPAVPLAPSPSPPGRRSRPPARPPTGCRAARARSAARCGSTAAAGSAFASAAPPRRAAVAAPRGC